MTSLPSNDHDVDGDGDDDGGDYDDDDNYDCTNDVPMVLVQRRIKIALNRKYFLVEIEMHYVGIILPSQIGK